MKTHLIALALTFSATALFACEEQKPADAGADKPAASAKADEKKDEKADAKAGDEEKKETEEAKAKPDEKPDYDVLADSVKFTQGEEADGKFKGSIENTGKFDIGLLEYRAFAYGKDDKLLEMIKGKFPKKLAAGDKADVEVGPFTKTAGQEGVTVEVVVSWMNVDGTSWQRPVPDDRAKGGPNNALKK